MSDKSSFALHQFSEVLIFQTTENIELFNGLIIPAGYVNATQILQAASKQTGKKKLWSAYIKKESTLEFLKVASEDIGVPIFINNSQQDIFIENSTRSSGSTTGFPALCIVINGGSQPGTWVHKDVAINLAQWCSAQLSYWAAKTLNHVIEGNFEALTPEAKKAQEEIQQIWHELRTYTKETFWFLTDSIKAYYEQHPRVEKYNGQNYSEALDCLNIGLFGKRSKEIKEELGIGKNQLNRNHFGKESLKKIEMVQRIAQAQIEHLGLSPIEAVGFAIKTMNYSISDYRK